MKDIMPAVKSAKDSLILERNDTHVAAALLHTLTKYKISEDSYAYVWKILHVS